MRRLSIGLALAALTLAPLAATTVAATPAYASLGSGACSSNDGSSGADECLYYAANETGACFADPIKDAYGSWNFAACTSNPSGDHDPNTGAGFPVKDDAHSAQNWSHVNTCHIWSNANFTGPHDDNLPFTAFNLNHSLNLNKSQSWG